jgi:hypothetical protein
MRLLKAVLTCPAQRLQLKLESRASKLTVGRGSPPIGQAM